MKVPTIEPLEARIAPAVLTIVPVEADKAEGNTPGGSTNFTFKVLIGEAEPQDVTVVATLKDGTAKLADGDFNAFTQTITIPKGQTEATFSVPIKQDTTVEPDETFSVELSLPSVNATIGQGTAEGTIRNDDFPKVSVVALDSSLAEGSAPAGETDFRFDVVLDRVAEADVTVMLTIKDGTAKQVDGDFENFSVQVTIPAGQLKATDPVLVPIKHDTVVEPNETFSVELTSPSSNAVIGTATATATILNDDPARLIVENATVIEGANGGTSSLRFKVRLSTEAPEDVTFDYFTGIGGTATAGVDFTSVGTTAGKIEAGQTETWIDVQIIGDDVDEVDESVLVNVTNAKMGTNSIVIQGAPGGTAVATGTIRNDDLTISLTGPGTVVEGNAPSASFADYVVTRNGSTTHAVQVTFEVVAGTAKLGSDFSLPSTLTLTIPANSTSATLRVPITVDSTFEADETFQVRVASVTNAVVDGQEFVETTILNDDAAPTLRFSQVTPMEVTEGTEDAQFNVVVSLSAAAGQDVTFNWSTVDGTAIGGLDFEAVTGQTVTIAAGQTSTTLVLTKKGDKIHEVSTVTDGTGDQQVTKRAEMFSIVLSDATNATIDGAAGTRTVRIMDDDAAPILRIDDTEVLEDGGLLRFKVYISNDVTADRDIDFNWSAGLGSATPGVDYTVLTGTPAKLVAGEKEMFLELNVVNDGVNEIDETVIADIGSALMGATQITVADRQATGKILNDDLLVNLEAINQQVIEGGAETTTIAKYRVSIPAPSAHDVSVTIEFDDEASTAAFGTDFRFDGPTTVTIRAGETSVDFDVTIIGDTGFETDESIVLNLVNSVNVKVGTGTATATIQNDDELPRIAIENASVEEGNSGNKVMNFTVKLVDENGEDVPFAGEDITFDWSTLDGAAIGGVDFSKVVNRQGTILKGQSSAVISVAISGDLVDEADENFSVVLSNAMLGATALDIANGTATGTIENDDLIVRISNGSVVEGTDGATNLNFTVSIPQISAHDVTVTYEVNEGTALAGIDYGAPSTFTVTIPAGQTAATISIPIITDSLHEANETFTVKLVDAVNAKLGVATATGTIINDDAAPIITIDSVSKAEGGSGTTPFEFKIRLSAPSGQDVFVLVTPTSGTAAAGTDFVAQAKTIRFLAGETVPEEEFIVMVNGDTAYENAETFSVVLSNATGAVISTTDGTGTGTIENDDPLPTLTIASTTGTEQSGVMTFTISLKSGASGLPVTFTATTGDGTAKAGSDYTAKTQNFTIAPGQTSATFTVPITNDALFEREENFSVTLSNVTNADLESPVAQGTITNVEDLEPTVTVSDVTVVEGDSGEKEFVVTVSLTHLAGSDVTFDWSVLAGTATEGVDFTVVSDHTVQGVIPAGQSSVTLKFKALGDSINEADETFSVQVANAKAGDDVLRFTDSKDTALVTLQNDENTVSVDDVTVVEGDSGLVDMVFTIRLSSASDHAVTVMFKTQDGTAISTGSDTVRDFDAIIEGTPEGKVTFAPNETEQTVTVKVRGDQNFDGTDTLKLLLTSSTNARIADGEGVGTITDDDARPVITIEADEAAQTVKEDAGKDTPPGTTTLKFKVKLDHASDETVEVSVSTINGTATAGSDFTGITNQRVVFAPGELEKFVEVTVLNDQVFEGDQTFTLALSDPLRATLGAEKTGIGTIEADDDAEPQIAITGSSILEGNNGERFMSFVVTRTGATDEPITFRFRTIDGTAVAGADYEAIDEPITMAAGEATKTVLVKITGDTTDESDEQFEVEISELENAKLAGDATTQRVTGTILNDDLTVKLNQGVVEVSEGNSGQSDMVFTVERGSNETTHAVEVTYVVGGGTATAGEDYIAPTVLTVTIPAGQTSAEIRIPIVGDTTAEAAETLTVTLTGAKHAVLAETDLTATGTILNDDAALRISDARLVEGSSGTSMMEFVVTLDAPFSFPVTVNYQTTNGTAVAGIDYTATNGTVTFAIGQTTQKILVPILGDTSVEGDEQFTVTLANPAGAAIVGSATATGTIQDDESFFSVNDVSIDEGDAGTRTLNFTVSRSPGIGIQSTVRVSTLDGTAVSTGLAPDFVAKSQMLTFGPNETTKTFSVVVIGDLVYELGSESFSVILSDPTGAAISDGEGTGTIKSGADAKPSIRIDDASVFEGDSGTKVLKFVVSLSQASDVPVDFDFITELAASGNLADSADFEAVNQTFTIPAGQKTFEVEVLVNGDTANEPDEVLLGKITGARLVEPGKDPQTTAPVAVTIASGQATGTIRNDEIAVSIEPAIMVVEGNGAVSANRQVLISLSGPAPAGGVEVSFQIAGGTATAGTDFTIPAVLTAVIPEGASSVMVDVPVFGDALDENDETLTFTITGAKNAQLSDGTVSTVSITDDDAAPIIEQVTDVSVAEGANAVFTVKLAAASGKDVIVKWVTEYVFDGADVGDFQHFGGVQTLVIPAGQTTGTITIGTTNDTTDESDETFRLRILANGTENATMTGDVVATGTILKNDLAAFSISDATVIEGAAGTTSTLAFTVSRTASNLPASVKFGTSDGTAKLSLGDYVANSGTLDFAVGESSKTIFVTINGDDVSEIDETVFVGIFDPVNGTVTRPTATGKILNDEVTYKIDLANAQVNEEGGTVTFNVVRSGAANAIPGTVFYTTAANSATGAVQATAGVDYEAKSGAIAFAAGVTSVSITIPITADTLPEGNETFAIKLSNAVNGQIDATEGEKIVTILDNDQGNLPAIVIDNAKLVEGPDGVTSDMLFKVRLVDMATKTVAQAAGGPITVTFSVAGGTATDGTDYTVPTTLTVTFAAGETVKDIRIPILGDGVIEPDETFNVSINEAVFAVPGTNQEIEFPSGNLPTEAAVGTITNDELTITIDPLSQFAEGNGTNTITFTARIPEALSGHDVSFVVKSKDGTAIAGAEGDYLAVDQIVTILAGETSATFTITVNGDVYAEGNETFSLLFSDPSNALLGATSRVITILNDDAVPSLSVGDATVTESDNGQTVLLFEVVLSGATLEPVTFDFKTVDGTAKSSGALIDYLARSGSHTFAASSSATQTHLIEVPIFGDTWKEDTEEFSIELSNAKLGGSSSGVTIADGTGTGTIEDNGDTTLGVIVHDAKVAEGSGNTTMQFVVETTAKVTGADVTLRADTRAGTANAADFTALQNRVVTIAVGQNQTTVPVTILGDGTFEAAEHFLLDITGFNGDVKAVNGSATTATATGVILNDDVNIISSRQIQYMDADGDLVTVKFSKGTIRLVDSPVFGPKNVTFSAANALGGQTIDLINLAIDGFAFEGVSISVTAKPQILVTGEVLGDAKANVGSLVAASLNSDLFQISAGIGLGKIQISGNLGQLITGSTQRPLGATLIEVGSFGSDSNVGSVVLGPIAKMIVHGDFMGNMRVIGDASAQPIPGGGVGRIGNLIIEGALKGGTNEGSGRITFTGGIGRATIGSIEGGSGQSSATLVSFSNEFNTRIGSLTVLGDIVGGSGTESALVEADHIGSVTIGKAGRTAAQQIEGNILGGSGQSSALISANTYGRVTVYGDIRGGSGDTSGSIQANESFGPIRLTGDLAGGAGAGSGLILTGSLRGATTIEGDVVGGSGANSGLLLARGVGSGIFAVPGNASSIVLGKSSVSESGNLIGGSGEASGRIDVNGNLGRFLAYGDIEGGKGASSGSLLIGGKVNSATVKGSILGGSTDASDVANGVSSLLGSGFIQAGRIGSVIVDGSVESGDNNGTALAKSGGIHSSDKIDNLKIGTVSGNAKVPVVISALRGIGKATFAGDVEFLELLAGYTTPGNVAAPRGTLSDAGASIGSVVVNGTFTASSIVAGAHAGADGKFGTADDIQTSNGNSVPGNQELISRIASVKINQVGEPEDAPAGASYGIVAEHVKSLRIAGARVPLANGPSNDGPDPIGPDDSKLQIFEIR